MHSECSKPWRNMKKGNKLFIKGHAERGSCWRDMNYVIYSLSRNLVHFFQKNVAAFCYKQATKFSCTSQGAQGFHRHTLNTGSKAAGNDSSLLPHILFMFQAFMPRLATGHISVCECAQLRGVCAMVSVQISWFILPRNTLADLWLL